MCGLNDEWGVDRRSKVIAGGCGNEWRKEWKRKTVAEIWVGFSKAFARANFVFAQANHSLDERSEVLKHSLERTLYLLERTTLWMKALERTRVCSSDHFSVWVHLSELWICSSDHFSVWVCPIDWGTPLESSWFWISQEAWILLDTYVSSKLALWLINAKIEIDGDCG